MDSQARPRSLRELSESRVLIFNDGYRTKQAELGTPGFPILRVAQVRDGFIESDDSFDFVRVEFRRKIGPKLAKAGDIVVSTKGTVGRRARLEIDQPYVYSPQVCFFRVLDPGVLDPDYLYYWLGSRPFLGQIDGLKAQTDMAEYVNLRDLARIQLDVPPIRVQRRIASVLRALDDKIELNRRMNQTLEATARTIFKSWFVDFDPVRAKMDGRQPSDMDAETAAMFPDSLQGSELGAIPDGWRVVAIAEIARLNALTLRNEDEVDPIQYVEISSVARGDVLTVEAYPRGHEPSRARRRVQHGDTVLSTVRPERRAFFLCLHPPANLIVSTGFVTATPIDVPWSFVHAALTQENVFDHLGHMAEGGAYPAIRPEVLGGWKLALPSDPRLLAAYDRMARPLFERATLNRREVNTLATLRDSLLPKLMSGEIPIASHADVAGDTAKYG